MSRGQSIYRVMTLALLLQLATIAGCDWSTLAGNTASFALGVLTGSQLTTTTTQYRCFRGGVEIPCGDVIPPESP